MKWIIRLYLLVLLGYTGWRTYDFMSMQIPSQEVGALLPLFFLFATEVGLALWHEVSLHHVSTHEQYNLAVSLTWLDFGGSLAAGVADMILRQTLTTGYEIPTILIYVLLYGLPLIVALNIAGGLMWFSFDGEVQIERAKRHLRFEITAQALKELGSDTRAIAQAEKKQIYTTLRDEVTGTLDKEYSKERSKAQAGSTNKIPSKPLKVHKKPTLKPAPSIEKVLEPGEAPVPFLSQNLSQNGNGKSHT